MTHHQMITVEACLILSFAPQETTSKDRPDEVEAAIAIRWTVSEGEMNVGADMSVVGRTK